jgi:hypothetical protein
MNDDSMREAAAERLLTAELVAVLAPTAAAKTIAWWPRWAAAAVAVFGLLTVLGVAALRAREGALAQQPVFDPLDPASADWPMPVRSVEVADVRELAAVPATTDAIVLHPTTQDLLTATARRPGLKTLYAMRPGGGAPLSLGALSVANDLENLVLGTQHPASELRELRHLPRLRRLALYSTSLDFDEATAQAIAEAPFLRQLVLGSNPPRAEGIRALSGLPDLEFLGVHQAPPYPTEHDWLDELPRLRGLKGLRLEGVPIPGNFAAILAQLPKLRLLQLSHVECDDSVLAAVPPWIERLQLCDIRKASALALLDLSRCRKLRSLGFRAGWSPHHDTLCDLLRRLPLEQFEAFVDAPSDEIWKVLQEKANLRLLRICVPWQGLTPQIAQVARCRALEGIQLVSFEIPSAASFQPLLGMPQLRRIDILRNKSLYPRGPAPELPELRAMFAGRVEIHVD